MSLSERLRLVRGSVTQKAFAEELGLHENTVANAERRGSATNEYLLKIAAARGINLHWLLTGQGPMRTFDNDPTLLQETLSLALADAQHCVTGARRRDTRRS